MAPHAFTPWQVDPDLGVCDMCGREPSHGEHLAPSGSAAAGPYAPYLDAVFAFALAHGGVPHTMGGVSYGGSIAALAHLQVCSLDIAACVPPEPAQGSEFVDSDTDYRVIELSQARLSCRCGLLSGLPWRVADDLTLGEVIYQVVTAGGPATPSGPSDTAPAAYQAHLDASFAKLLPREPLASRRLLARRFAAALYAAVDAHLNAQNRPGRAGVESDEVWRQVVSLLEQFDAESFALLMRPGSLEPGHQLTFRQKRLFDWP